MAETPRKRLSLEAEGRAQALSVADLVRWQELREDAATDFQRACLEAALVAGHPVPALHAFADAIRQASDGELAEAVRPAAGEKDPDPLKAFEKNGRVLSPRAPSPPPRPPEKPVRLLDLSGGLGPPRYGNVLDATSGAPLAPRRELGGIPSSGASGPPAGRSSPAVSLFDAAGHAFGVRFAEHRTDSPATLARAIGEAQTALGRGIPVPVVLGRGPGDLRRWALLLQTSGEGPRLAFQLHDPFADDTVWINHRDLAAGRELPLEDKSFRCVTAFALPH